MRGELLIPVAFSVLGIGVFALFAALWSELTGPRRYCAWCGRRAPRHPARAGWRVARWHGKRGEDGLVCSPACIVALATDDPTRWDGARNPCGAGMR